MTSVIIYNLPNDFSLSVLTLQSIIILSYPEMFDR